MSQPLTIYIGFDQFESVSFHVLSHSILKRASAPVYIVPLVQETLRKMGIYWRDRSPLESTSFSLTRFLCPYISGYRGHSVFLDQDMLVLCDICELWDEIHRNEIVIKTGSGSNRICPDHTVLVCQHDYVPKSAQKMAGQVQTSYKMKNWTSCLVFNNERCTMLTPEYVNTASGLDLHQFAWIGDGQIRGIPLEWNVLIGEDNQSTNPPKILHYTQGLPIHPEYKDCGYADLWWAEYEDMRTPIHV